MLDMAERKKPDRKPDRKKTKRKGVPLGVYVSAELFAAFDKCVEESEPRTSKKGIIEMLLKRYLEQQGYWSSPSAKEGE